MLIMDLVQLNSIDICFIILATYIVYLGTY